MNTKFKHREQAPQDHWLTFTER